MTAAGLTGASRESLAAARETLVALVGSGEHDLARISDELFSVTGLLDREPALRRALTDPSRDPEDRADLARAVLGSRAAADTTDLLVWAVRARWSAPPDLADALELLAVEAQVAAAEQAGRLDAVEDELFRTGRIVAGAAELRSALADPAAPSDSRAALVEDLLAGRTAEQTRRLVRQAVLAPRGRSFDRVLETYAQVAADWRRRLVATVTAAAPLTEAQRDRLAAALLRRYGHQVHLNVQLDPAVLGGIRVQVGDEVIDGSVAHRIDEARRRLVG